MKAQFVVVPMTQETIDGARKGWNIYTATCALLQGVKNGGPTCLCCDRKVTTVVGARLIVFNPDNEQTGTNLGCRTANVVVCASCSSSCSREYILTKAKPLLNSLERADDTGFAPE